ncbi:MAG: DUF4173 domain-containing protein [Eubacterium sp.]|nr:DUF4173 domain-containing protein [Eubacterium sp.]
MDNNDKFYYYNPSQDAARIQSSAPQITEARKAPFNFSKKDKIFTVLFFALSVLMVDFVMFHGFNLGFTISFILMFILATVYLFKKENTVSPFCVISGILSLTGSVTFTLYHDYFVNAVMLLLIMGLFTIYVCGLSNTFTHNEGSVKILINMLQGVFFSPEHYVDIRRSIASSYSKSKNIKSIVLGIAVSIPVLVVVIPLLASGDAAFSGLLTKAFENIGIYVAELFAATAVAAYMIPYFVVKNKRLGIREVKQRNYNGVISPSLITTFLSIISVTYLVYLFSQLAYFFSAFSGFLPDGYKFTESEYARRGFFEMFAICVINFIIVTLAGMLSKKNGKGKIPLSVKALSVFIVLFSTLLLITAMAKMKLNIEIFGLTKNRVMVSIFMIMIFVVIVFYVIHIFAPEFSYMQSMVVICSAIFIGLVCCNIDGGIAKYNTEKYLSGELETIDVDYLYSLSDSAYPYILTLADSDDHLVTKDVKHAVGRMLYQRYADYSNIDFVDNYTSELTWSPLKDFREFNLAVHHSAMTSIDYYNSIDKDERSSLVHQYTIDEDEYYWYDSAYDSYFKYDDNGNCNKYSYNEKSGRYEYMGVIDNPKEWL